MNIILNNAFMAIIVIIYGTWNIPCWDIINLHIMRAIAALVIIILIVFWGILRNMLKHNPEKGLSLVMNMTFITIPSHIILSIYWIVEVAPHLPTVLNNMIPLVVLAMYITSTIMQRKLNK